MRKASLKTRRRLRKKASRVKKTAKLGSGKRFKAVMASAKAGGARDPAAVAAVVGRKKYGKKKMAKLSAKGRKRKAKKRRRR